MAFPSVPWTKVQDAAIAAIHEWGVDATVQLKEQCPSFTIKATRIVPNIKSATRDLTDGLVQNEVKSMVLYDDWHANAQRAPEKGDTLMFAGRIHAVTGAYLVQVESVNFGYDIRLKG